jgi:hypothetical protein
MAMHQAAARSTRPLLTLGRIDRIWIQVGFRMTPTAQAYEQFLLDLTLDEERSQLEEAAVVSALEPILYAGDGPPRHYSLHQHRWSTSWGPSPGALELGLLITTSHRSRRDTDSTVVGEAFRALLGLAGLSATEPITRDAAVVGARRAAEAAYGIDQGARRLTFEMHDVDARAWRIGLRDQISGEYDVVVGLVDGYARAIRVRHEAGVEVVDSVGSD